MFERKQLVNSTLIELREIAENLKIEGYANLKKEYLVEEIVKTLISKDELKEKTEIKIENPETDYIAEGIIEIINNDGLGFLRSDNFLPSTKDIYVSPVQVRRFNLETGDKVRGIARFTNEGNNKFPSMIFIESINDDPVEVAFRRKSFDKLIPIYPTEKLKLNSKDLSTRLIDIISPIGKGQRGLIVAPPKAGKTTLLKEIANSISKNNPECYLMVVLIDERPEEVTDMQRSINGEVIYSTFDEETSKHIKVAKMALERAKRLLEHNKDVVILLDSLTRLTRANNMEVNSSGKLLSGGIDPAAFHLPKKIFGAARNIEAGGSLTVLATALVETGSRMDDVIFEEFKGTGNMEIHLDRNLAQKGIYPAIDILKSGTRKDDLLLSKDELKVGKMIRKTITNKNSQETVEKILDMIKKTKTNEEFVNKILKK